MRLVLILLSTTVAACGLAVSGTAASNACGPQQLGGATVRTWCGKAKATVVWGGKKMSLKGGECSLEKVSGLALFAVNVGRYTVPRAKPKFKSFSAAGSDLKPGTYRAWLVNFQTPGKQWTLKPTTTIVKITAAGAKKGTFTGKLYEGGKIAKGSWSC